MATNVEPESFVPTGGKAARLCNFPTGVLKPVLLADHRTWLTKNVVDVLRADSRAAVELIGMASHLGTHDKNQRLSDSRALAVEEWLEGELRANLPRVSFADVGDSQSGGARNNDDEVFKLVLEASTCLLNDGAAYSGWLNFHAAIFRAGCFDRTKGRI